MEPTRTVPAQRQPLEVVRTRRAAMREALVGLEAALGGAAAGREDEWRAEVAEALGELRDAFDDHVAATEGPDGLYAEITARHERLVNAVRRLGAEHVGLTNDLTELQTLLARPGPVLAIRELGTMLLARFSRHRQRGADLVYQAYDVDIGGE